MSVPRLGNLVPYLYYADLEAMLGWYGRVFGFIERRRWHAADGSVENAEMHVGDTELWMDGSAAPGIHDLAGEDGSPRPLWIGVWLESPSAVDALHDHIVSEGVVPVDRPHDRPFGVRTFTVEDPEGYTWGFMCRIASSE